jgi:hypothetical protein
VNAQEKKDLETVVGFILGWFPGYESAIYWGSSGPKGDDPTTNEVYQAAKRIAARLQGQSSRG